MKKSKYKNIKCSFNGIKFDSIGEANCYQYWKFREAAKEVQVLALQEKIYLSDARILYKPDFTIYHLANNETYWIDYKGVETQSFKIKKRLWRSHGPGKLILMRGSSMFRMEVIEEVESKLGKHIGKRNCDASKTSRRPKAQPKKSP